MLDKQEKQCYFINVSTRRQRVLTKGDSMQLDLRKKKILQAIVNEYINTAEPVGSRYIAKKRELGLSSATIRNEMADLEEMGYLAQPHTSAGRVPSDKGYRLYVDDLMEIRELTLEEVRVLRGELSLKINELNTLIKSASAAISKLTNYTSVTLTPSSDDCEVKKIETVLLDSSKVYVIVVSMSGAVKNSLANLSVKVDKETLALLTGILQDKLYGYSASRIGTWVLKEIKNEFKLSEQTREFILVPLLKAVFECLTQMSSAEIFLEGTTNIFSFPEFRNIERAQEFLKLMEDKKSITNVLSGLAKEENIKMLIGNENSIEEIKECSIVSATYSTGDLVLGTIGIIGPKRMEYSKVVSMMEYMNRMIASELNKLITNMDEE